MSVAGKRSPVARSAIALAKIAFHFEVELLRKIAGEIDPRAAQAKPIIYCGLTKPAFERRDRRRPQNSPERIRPAPTSIPVRAAARISAVSLLGAQISPRTFSRPEIILVLNLAVGHSGSLLF